MRAKSGSTGRGILYSVTAGAASIAAGLALLPLVIGTIGVAPYGVWLFLIAISSYFNYTDLGVGTAIIHFGSRARGGGEQVSMSQLLSAAILWTAGIGVLVIPLYALISWSYVDGIRQAVGIQSSDAFALTLLATAVACGLLIRPFSAALVGAGYLLLDRKYQFVGVVVRVIGTVIACTVFGSIAAVAIAETVALLCPTLLAMATVLSKKIARIEVTRALLPTLKHMMSYSTRAFAVSISSALIGNGGTLIIGMVGTPTQVTYFAAATRVLTGIGQITSWASTPFQSTLSRLYHSAPELAKKMVRNLVFSSFSVSSVCCGILILASYPLVELWLGSAVDTHEVATTMIILLFGAVLNSLQRPLLLASEGVGKPGMFFRTQFAIAVVFGCLGLILGPLYGAMGVAVARLVPIMLASPFYILISRKHFDLGLRIWWKESFFPAAMFLVPSMILAVLAIVITNATDNRGYPGLAALVFGFGCIVFALVFRSRLPIRELRASLRTTM